MLNTKPNLTRPDDIYAKLIAALSLPHCDKGEFISHKLANDIERTLARQHGARKRPLR